MAGKKKQKMNDVRHHSPPHPHWNRAKCGMLLSDTLESVNSPAKTDHAYDHEKEEDKQSAHVIPQSLDQYGYPMLPVKSESENESTLN